MPRSCPLLYLAAIGGMLSCSPTPVIVRQPEAVPAPPAPVARPPEESVHLVVDLGSSGTRFCLYRVLRHADKRGCGMPAEKPVCSRVQGGLAKLTKGRRAGQIAGLIEPQLRSAWSQLGDAEAGGDPGLRSRVRGAVALGTGGFRDRKTGLPISRPEWQTLFQEVGQFLKRETNLGDITARPITGGEEGRLAWMGLSHSENRPAAFAAVEAGGATVQLAIGKSGDGNATVEVATDPLGQDVVFEHYVQGGAGLAKTFEVCYSPRHLKRQDGPRCVELLSREVFQSSAVRRLAEKAAPQRLFGLGLSFADLFRSYPAAPPWTKKQDRVMHDKLSFSANAQLTALLCPLSDNEIKAYAPNALAIQKSHSSRAPVTPGRACYYLAYRTALLEAIRHVAAAGELHSAEEDQWTRGAAVSGDFFEGCK